RSTSATCTPPPTAPSATTRASPPWASTTSPAPSTRAPARSSTTTATSPAPATRSWPRRSATCWRRWIRRRRSCSSDASFYFERALDHPEPEADAQDEDQDDAGVGPAGVVVGHDHAEQHGARGVGVEARGLAGGGGQLGAVGRRRPGDHAAQEQLLARPDHEP